MNRKELVLGIREVHRRLQIVWPELGQKEFFEALRASWHWEHITNCQELLNQDGEKWLGEYQMRWNDACLYTRAKLKGWL